MSALICDFPDKIRFYDQVLKTQDRRVFVPTQDNLRAGQEVEVQIRIGSREPVQAHAKVVATRAKGGVGQEPGVWITFSPAQGEVLRQLLQVGDGEGADITARTAPRFDAVFPVLVDKPVRAPLRASNVSAGGVCLSGILPVPVGQTIHMVVEFADEPISVFGKVVWRRDDAHLVGVSFRFQSEQTRRQVADHVRRIADERSLLVHGKPTILIVDDDVGALRALERVLSHRGYGVITASSGPEALSLARERTPAMLLIDVLLPGMNGVELCRALKCDVGTSRVPAVLMSVLPRGDLEILLRESGALAALPKPYRFEVLAGLVQQIIEHNQSLPVAQAQGGGKRRLPLFERCIYESRSLRVETSLREALENGLFLVSAWGDAVGQEAKLTILNATEEPVTLQVKVVQRYDWGVLEEPSTNAVAGMALEILEGAGRQEYRQWLSRYREALEDKPLVLVVDDDRNHLEILRDLLRNIGCGVVIIDSSFGVANAVALSQPALVILDFMMPGIDGGSLCRTIKGNPSTRDVPVWLYSSVSDGHLEELAKGAQADGWVRKGARLSDLVTKVAEFLRLPVG